MFSKLSIHSMLLFVSSSGTGSSSRKCWFRQKQKLRKLLFAFGYNLMNSLPNEPENPLSPPACSWFHLDRMSMIPLLVLILAHGDVFPRPGPGFQGAAALCRAEVWVSAVTVGQTEVSARATVAVANWCWCCVAILRVVSNAIIIVKIDLFSIFWANNKSPEFFIIKFPVIVPVASL